MDPFKPIEPIQDDGHGLAIGLGVAAALLIILIICGIVVIIQNRTNTVNIRIPDIQKPDTFEYRTNLCPDIKW